MQVLWQKLTAAGYMLTKRHPPAVQFFFTFRFSVDHWTPPVTLLCVLFCTAGHLMTGLLLSWASAQWWLVTHTRQHRGQQQRLRRNDAVTGDVVGGVG